MDKKMDIETLIGTAVYAFTKSLIASGMSPTVATRVVGFAVIEGTLGREASRTLGVSRPTMARWRAQLAEVAEAGQDLDEKEVTLDAVNAMLPLLGLRDLRMVKGDDGEG